MEPKHNSDLAGENSISSETDEKDQNLQLQRWFAMFQASNVGSDISEPRIRLLIQNLCQQIYLQNIIIVQQAMIIQNFQRPQSLKPDGQTDTDINQTCEKLQRNLASNPINDESVVNIPKKSRLEAFANATAPSMDMFSAAYPSILRTSSTLQSNKETSLINCDSNFEMGATNSTDADYDYPYDFSNHDDSFNEFITIGSNCVQDPEDETRCSLHKIRHRTRTKLSPSEVLLLKTIYESTPSPSKRQFDDLANQTGLPTKVLKVWFQNTRRLRRNTCKNCGRVFVTNHLFLDHSKTCN